MLQDCRVGATLPAQDIERAKAFYERLGFSGKQEMDGITYECADGTGFMVFPSSGAANGTHTQLGFDVKDLDAEVAMLRDNGVKLEEYDMPDFKTENGIFTDPNGGRGAWFKDSEGNLISIYTS